MDNYALILQDLQQDDTESISIFPIHNSSENLKQQVTFLMKQLRRAKSMNNRRETLMNAWYIGEVIETKTTT